jgi:hypothetical protein
LRADGTVTAWGYDDAGRFPVPAGLDDVVAIAANEHSLALRADGTVTAWGSNWGGQTNVPTWLGDVGAIAAGAGHSLALVDLTQPPPVRLICAGAWPAFYDVLGPSIHADNIYCVAYQGLAHGHPDGTYRPANGVRRDQLASFIVRTLEAAGHTLPAPAHTFTDIAGNTHEHAIGQLAAAGIVRGRTPATYAPARTVTRDQIASYLVRALDWAHDTTHTAPPSPFTDITGNTHERAIHTAYDLGLTTGRTPTTYEPRTEVRRDQMASFLVRLLPHALHPR